MNFEKFIKSINSNAKLIKLDDYKGENKKLYNLRKESPNIPLVFEDWWKYKQEIIKSILSIKKNFNIKKYYARKLSIKEIKNIDLVKNFLNENHLQGFCKSSIKIGLFNDKELIELITFGKSRFSKCTDYELLRLATKKYTTVVGGTNRLFKYFITKYNNPSIVSYDDQMLFDGHSYISLGFKLKSNDTLGYTYYNSDKRRINRLLFQKHKLQYIFEDVDMTLTESEICKQHGYNKIYDCGQGVWLYNSNLTERDKILKNIEQKWNITWLNPTEKINSKVEYNFKCKKCGNEWSQKIRFDRNLSCPNCYPYSHGSSKGEIELYDILNTSGLKIVHNDRNALQGKELDIYFPEIKLAIEYDGKFWHSKETNDIKNKLCKEKEITLLRVDNENYISNKEKIIKEIVDFINIKYCKFSIDYSKVKNFDRVSGKCRKIICLNDNKIYNNYLEVLKAYGLKEASDLLNVCNGTIPNYHGYKFKYYNNETVKSPIKKEYNYHTKHILCIETNEVFESIRTLIKLGIKTIFDCVSGRQETAHGLHWEYTDLEVTDNKKTLEKLNSNKILCIETGKIYKNYSDIKKELNILGVEAVINGRRKTAGGYHWTKV